MGGDAMSFYAHTLDGSSESEWQTVEDHLEGVSKLAGSFASAFGSEKWGEIVGLWHDLGKYSNAFQSYLRQSGDPSCSARVDHSTAGARQAVAADSLLGYIMAYAIAGHHGGMPDGRSVDSCLEKRLQVSITFENGQDFR